MLTHLLAFGAGMGAGAILAVLAAMASEIAGWQRTQADAASAPALPHVVDPEAH